MVCGVDVGGGGLVGLITGGSSVPVASRHSPDAAGIIKRRTTARTAAPMRRRRIRSPSRMLRIPRSGISSGSRVCLEPLSQLTFEEIGHDSPPSASVSRNFARARDV